MNPDHVRKAAMLTIEFLKRTDLKGVENQSMTECFAFLNAFLTEELQVINPRQDIPPRKKEGVDEDDGEGDVSH